MAGMIETAGNQLVDPTPGTSRIAGCVRPLGSSVSHTTSWPKYNAALTTDPVKARATESATPPVKAYATATSARVPTTRQLIVFSRLRPQAAIARGGSGCSGAGTDGTSAPSRYGFGSDLSPNFHP